MKIRQKLMLGFVGTSLVVGVTACISVITSARIKHDVTQVNQSSIKEVAASTEMILALEAIQTAAQELLVEKYRAMLKTEDPAEAEEKAKSAQEKMKQSVDKFEKSLNNSKNATETAIKLAKTGREKIEIYLELAEIKRLNKLSEEFSIYKKFLSQYLYLANIAPRKADRFLDNSLSLHFRAKLLPLIREYQAQTKAELAREAREIESAIDSANKVISILTLSTLGVAIFLGFLISHSISKPLSQLKKATTQIIQGDLDTRVNIKTKDEIGILAIVFNRMVDELSTKTVAKSYIDKIINSMVEMLIVIKTDATITKVNQATIRVLGYEENELIGKHIQVVFTAEELSEELKFDNLIKTGLMRNIETTYLTKDGRKIPVSCSGSVLRDDNGKIQGILCVAQDITERKQASERLEAAFTSQRDFINDASHELRTPIAIVRCYLELLSDDPQERRKTLALVIDELDRMSRFVNDLLLLCKAEQPDFLNLEIVEISSLTEELYVKASALAARNWCLEAKGSGRIIADRQRLTQAVLNLAQNATEYTTERDLIALGSSLSDANACFWVRDTGEGIATAEQQRIFQRFARGSSGRRSQGAGLGLAIVQAIALAHSGRVELCSQPGCGSTFTIVIPL